MFYILIRLLVLAGLAFLVMRVFKNLRAKQDQAVKDKENGLLRQNYADTYDTQQCSKCGIHIVSGETNPDCDEKDCPYK